ncbi:MAG: aminoglycoside phosphotransferase family protein [Bdellovibrionota bacterium]
MSATETILRDAHDMIVGSKPGSGKTRVLKLAGDASLRRYYRLWSGNDSFVLMLTEPLDPAKFDFLLVRTHLEKCGVPVPKVITVDGPKGAILLEDLGDRTMLHRLGELNNLDAEEELFVEALELLATFHSKTRVKAGEKPVPGYGLAFDEEKLMWEVDFTLEHLFGSYLKRKIPEKEFALMRETFVDIVKRLAAEPRVFTHRDYHSRNIMIPPSGKMVCIDFQDARMGLRAYDLASILRDSYYQLSEGAVYKLVDKYLALAGKDEKIDKEHFLRMFDLMSIQRNFKAIGSFTSFYGKRNDAMYIRFVGNTFENIRRNLGKFSEYRKLRELLFHYYYF